MSRNPHIPTDETRKLVRQLAGNGTPQADIAIMVGCSEKTLRLYYRDELDEGLQDANATVLAALMEKIRARNTTAMIFYDKCRGGRKETIKEEITGLQGGPILVGSVTQITPNCSEQQCDQAIERDWRHQLEAWRESENIDEDIRKVLQKIEELKANAKK